MSLNQVSSLLFFLISFSQSEVDYGNPSNRKSSQTSRWLLVSSQWMIRESSRHEPRLQLPEATWHFAAALACIEIPPSSSNGPISCQMIYEVVGIIFQVRKVGFQFSKTAICTWFKLQRVAPHYKDMNKFWSYKTKISLQIPPVE